MQARGRAWAATALLGLMALPLLFIATVILGLLPVPGWL
jgi:hypothetical protein